MVIIPPRARIRSPSYRHAAPCGPWPWINIDDEIPSFAQASGEPHRCLHPAGQCVGCWDLYPQSLFPNWTPKQVERSRMKSSVATTENCVIHRVEVTNSGRFYDPGIQRAKGDEEFWKILQDSKRGSDVRVRALFVENISVPVLQMLGTKYKVEPFFWSSSVNWIPSRYQEDLRLREGDHITITLSFPRATKREAQCFPPVSHITRANTSISLSSAQSTSPPEEVIDTQRPLFIESGKEEHALILDHLAMHMDRGRDSSTIISYQPTSNRQATTAASLHSRVYLAGQSVYWNKIFEKSNDPTFVLLTMLWYALYAWDQALEMLWDYICKLEIDVLDLRDLAFTRELHRVRAHLLHYASLLDDFRKSVEFVRDTPNPAIALDEFRHDSSKLMENECKNLLIQIQRLSDSRVFWDDRLQNIMNLAFSSVNIEESKQMKTLTEAALRDSTAMKQIAYLTMIFLPASFVSNAFGMNVVEINPTSSGTLAHYAETALPLTLVTVWFVVAMQGHWKLHDEDGSTREAPWWLRLSWPVMYLERRFGRRNGRRIAQTIKQKGWA